MDVAEQLRLLKQRDLYQHAAQMHGWRFALAIAVGRPRYTEPEQFLAWVHDYMPKAKH